ncbi:phage terminase large subunit [Jatrophihabitans sp.]|uniref:phage terminase large subunit n=1 Tax=Jatrophihabitans sp. TaxID=1932789 RepID=UPI0030C738B4
MAKALDQSTRQSPVLELIDDKLVRLAEGTIDRLMIFCPPQEGKSQRVSRRFPAWLLEQDPTLRIAIVSFEAGKAERWGRQIKRDIEAHPELGIVIRSDTNAAGRWETRQGGGLICVGISGGITGEPVDVLIIDDPVRGRAEAESKTYREAAWDWWESNGSTRLSERGRVVLMMTRWHTSDLAGMLLAKEPGEWEVLSIPAIAVDADDPLGRKPGEEMPSVRGRKPGFFAKLKALRSAYVFSSIYQQRPTAAEGGIFKRGDWRYWDLIDGRLLVNEQTFDLDTCVRFITMDLATSTKTSADYTVAAAWAITLNGDLVLLDRVRERVPQTDHVQLVEPLRSRWLSRYDVTYIESRMFGSTLVYAMGRKGLPVAELEADADKLTRALSAADLVRQNRVHLPRKAAWLDEWLDEHADFPNVAHDDQVDVMAYAARVAIAHWLPGQSAAEEQALAAAIVRDPEYVDLMTANF